jgi:hypothetical protein
MKKTRWKPAKKHSCLHRPPASTSAISYSDFLKRYGIGGRFTSRELLELPRLTFPIFVSASLDMEAVINEAVAKLGPHGKRLDPKTEQLLAVASITLQRLLDLFPHWRPEEAMDLIDRMWKHSANFSVKQPEAYRIFTISMQAIAGWYLDGMQVISLQEEVAAQLAATTIARQVLETVKMPWSSFVVRIPKNLIRYKDFDGSIASITDILISEVPGMVPPHFKMKCLGTGLSDIWEGSNSLADLLDIKVHPPEISTQAHESIVEALNTLEESDLPEITPKMLHLDDIDARGVQLCKNLVGALLVHFQENHLRLEAQGDFSGFDQEKNRRFPKPLRHVFEGKMPVKIDVRKGIKEYSMHGGKSPSVQTMVMGHWKMQPHGPRSTLRKRIYRAPYWKGNPAAKIALRPHTL